jgi:hypothetical protein
MPPVRISLAAQGVDEWRALAKKLRKKKEFRKNLRDQITAAGRPIVGEVQEAVLKVKTATSHKSSKEKRVWVSASEGSHGGGTSRRRTTLAVQAGRRARKSKKNVRAAIQRAAGKKGLGLRESIARATKLKVTARGVKFYVDSSKMPESQRNLPRLLDSEKGWRHPLFGNREDWVDQKGQPYFGATIKKKAPEFRRAIENAMNEVKRDLDS